MPTKAAIFGLCNSVSTTEIYNLRTAEEFAVRSFRTGKKVLLAVCVSEAGPNRGCWFRQQPSSSRLLPPHTAMYWEHVKPSKYWTVSTPPLVQ